MMSEQSCQQISESSAFVYDVICVGFGATALAVAVSLYEQHPNVNIAFLEPQQQSQWRPSAQLPGHRMPRSFLHDLITLQNPRSRFTYVNYLHRTRRLVVFTNVSQMQPSREQYQDYLAWCASHFETRVRYGTRSQVVKAKKDNGGMLEGWEIVTKDVTTGLFTSLSAKRVIVAAELECRLSPGLQLPRLGDAVVHVSQCRERILQIKQTAKRQLRIAIVGDGQQAAETFESLQDHYTTDKVTWYMRSTALRANGENAFTIDAIQQRYDRDYPPEVRKRMLNIHASPDIAPALADQLYENQYAEQVKEPDPSKWRFHIKPNSDVVSADRCPDGSISLTTQNTCGFSRTSTNTTADFDLVICATGYERTEHTRLLQPLRDLFDGRQLTVDAQYRVNLQQDRVAPDVGLWVLGSLPEASNSPDDVFNQLAEKGHRLTQSLVEHMTVKNDRSAEKSKEQARL